MFETMLLFLESRRQTMNDLLNALNAVTDDDFEKIQGEINAKRNELAALESLQKVIAIKLGKIQKPVRGESKSTNFNPPETDEEKPPAGTTQSEFRRKRVKEYLMANGPTPLSKIARQTGIPQGSMNAVLKHPWFVSTALGWGLHENHK